MVYSTLTTAGFTIGNYFGPNWDKANAGAATASIANDTVAVIPRKGVISNLYLEAASELSDQPVRMTLYVNGSAKALTAFIPADGLTASDNTHRVTVNQGDHITFKHDAADGNANRQIYLACIFIPS